MFRAEEVVRFHEPLGNTPCNEVGNFKVEGVFWQATGSEHPGCGRGAGGEGKHYFFNQFVAFALVEF